MNNTPRTSNQRVVDAVKDMADRWSREAIDFLDGEDHDEYATAAVISACIQIARCLIPDNDSEGRAYWVRVLSAEGVDAVEVDTQ